jgi:glycosyltransferase involved in cell wall biosynthesis
MLDAITPVLLTYNEAPNIGRALEVLRWAKRIVVVDSFSTDETLDILRAYPRAEVFQRAFDTHAQQWNYGVAQVKTEWVLSLDADYIIGDDFVAEIAQSAAAADVDGYFAPFKYCVFGKPLRGTLLPPRQVLFRKAKSTYVDDGHTQLLRVAGRSTSLKAFIRHDDRKALSRWLWAQDRYVILESQKLLGTPAAKMSLGDRLRRSKIAAPLIVPFYCLILQRGLLDGWAGWYYAMQRTLAEILLSIRLVEDERQQKCVAAGAAATETRQTDVHRREAGREVPRSA